jgi:hypothetical protein
MREEDFVWPANEVPAIIDPWHIPLPHLVPDSPQSVVRQKFDNIPRREELVPDR